MGAAVVSILGGCAQPTVTPAASERATRERFADVLADMQARTTSPVPIAPAAGSSSADPQPFRLAAAEIYPGPEPRAGSAGRGGEAPSGDVVDLNFVEADVREAVSAVLGDLLGLNYVVDPAVQGKITLRTVRPIPRSNVLPALEAALASSGQALIRADDLYRVLPMDRASPLAQVATALPGRMSTGYGTYLFPLDFTSAEQLKATLQPFVPQGRTLAADKARNMLLFSGTGREAQDLAELIEAFDIDALAGTSFGLLPVKQAAPQAIADELEAIFNTGAGPESPVTRFIPIDRLNALLVIAPTRHQLSEAQTWVSRLDRGDSGTQRRLFTYRVQNARAADLAKTLDLLYSPRRSGARPHGATVAPGLTPTDLYSGPDSLSSQDPAAESGAGDQSLAAVPASPSRLRLGIDPENVFAADLVSEDGDDIRIVSDEGTNSILVRATPEEYRSIEETLRQLDVVPSQVVIEATIAEVTLTDDLRYGLQWFFESGDSQFRFTPNPVGAINTALGGFTYLFNGADAQVVLNALSEITDVNVVSSPQILVRNNQPARLQVGDEVPVAIQSARSVIDPDAPIVNTIEYRDTGVILEVIPRVNSSGVVLLDIVQEVSDVVPTTTSLLNSPTIQQRRIESSVVVQSGAPVALGGLIRDGKNNIVQGIPVLSEVPILGNLFKTTSTGTARTELLVLITPKVVNTQIDARLATEELKERLRRLDGFETRIH